MTLTPIAECKARSIIIYANELAESLHFHCSYFKVNFASDFKKVVIMFGKIHCPSLIYRLTITPMTSLCR